MTDKYIKITRVLQLTDIKIDQRQVFETFKLMLMCKPIMFYHKMLYTYKMQFYVIIIITLTLFIAQNWYNIMTFIFIIKISNTFMLYQSSHININVLI